MRVCPTCGEVYSNGTGCCAADGASLIPWGAISDGELSPYTDVDPLAPKEAPGPLDDMPRASSFRLTRSSSPDRGRVLGGRYRLSRSLGVGGYGAVFAALDLQTAAQVAIKVLSPAVSQSPEVLTRFHREAIAASRVRHPSIVEVVDFDVNDDGTHYIVMEFLDGHDLADHLEAMGRLSPAVALAIVAQCAHGLAAAHRVGVVHRDLKPANVFLVRGHGGDERVKVIDFGISKLTGAAGDYTDVTSASRIVGTPRYMSPEHARGDELDGRADVYSLGVMLFEMLTGEAPFVGRSPLELFARHLRAPRPTPSSLLPELAACPGLDALVVRALAAERSARFKSMDEFADAIVASLRAIAPAAADEITDYSGEISEPRPVLQGRLARVTRRYVPSLALIAAAAVLAGVLAMREDGSTPSPARLPPPSPTALLGRPAPPPPEAASPRTVPASPPPEVTVDAGVLAPKLERSPPRIAPRRRAPNAAQLGVSEW